MFEAEMVVVWNDTEGELPGRESYQIGCAFLPMEEEKKQILQMYIDSLMKKQPGRVGM